MPVVRGAYDHRIEVAGLFEQRPEDDPMQRRPDISRAKKQLGWEPRIPLEEGLKATIGYFEAYLRSGSV